MDEIEEFERKRFKILKYIHQKWILRLKSDTHTVVCVHVCRRVFFAHESFYIQDQIRGKICDPICENIEIAESSSVSDQMNR